MGQKSYLLGIDLGTSSCKTVLFSLDGEIVISASTEYPTIYARKNWAEQNPELWWESTKKNIKEMFANSNVNPSDIICIGIDAQSSVVVPIDCNGNILRNAMIWTDRRSEKQCEWIDKNVGQEFLFKINGNKNDPSNFGPKLLWIKENCPEIYNNTDKFLNATGFLVYKLTGEISFNITEGALTQLFDTKKGIWSDSLIKECKLDRNKLVDIYNCHDIVGTVSQEVEKETGLKEGTPVIAGLMDATSGALGCGLINEGDAYITGGTVICVGICRDKPAFHPDLNIYHSPIPGRWISAAGVDFGGGTLRWFRDNFFRISENTKDLSYKQLDQEAVEIGAGADGLIFFPYMVGQRAPLWNSDTSGAFIGIKPIHRRAHFVRAIMEGNVYGIKYILKIVEELGITPPNIKLVGGCSKSSIWAQIFADITLKEIELPLLQDVAAFGAAFTAGVGIGAFKNYNEITKFLKYKSLLPDDNNKMIYTKLYNVYEDLYMVLKEKLTQIANI